VGLSRRRSSSLRRQNDQALIVSATMEKPGLFGIADRLLELRAFQADARPTIAAGRHALGLLTLRR
jgi:hypothetical protein